MKRTYILLAALTLGLGACHKQTIEEQEMACIEGCFPTCNVPGQAHDCYACVDLCVEALKPFRENGVR